MGVRNRVREVRPAQGLSQQRLAEVSGVSQSEISLVERGLHRPSLETGLRLAGALRAAVEGLFWLEDEPERGRRRGSAGRDRRPGRGRIGG